MVLSRVSNLLPGFVLIFVFCGIEVLAENSSIKSDHLGSDVRLFTTHAERVQLNLVRRQSSIAIEDSDSLPQQSAGRLVTYNGFIRNRKGETTIFSDAEGEVKASRLTARSNNMSSKGELTMNQGSGQSIQLKAGEGYRDE